jgi:hypothetical protein
MNLACECGGTRELSRFIQSGPGGERVMRFDAGLRSSFMPLGGAGAMVIPERHKRMS